MQLVSRPNISEHTAQHLREGISTGRWSGKLPGVWVLAQELGVSRDAVRAALRLLEVEGRVTSSGAGKSRMVNDLASFQDRRMLRVGILLPCAIETDNAHTHQLIYGIRQAVEALGHVCFISPKTSHMLGHKPSRIRSHLETYHADAWIIYSAEREVLEMSTQLDVPMFALGGVSEELQLTGSRTDLTAPIAAVTDLLVSQGHRQIVLICPPKWRHPRLNHAALAFINSMTHHGIRSVPHYNVPDWDHTPKGLHSLLTALFSATPPTAMLIMEPECVGPALVFLAQRGLGVPEDVSLINLLPDPMQSFYHLEIAHFEWPLTPHIRNVIRWLRCLARGQPDVRYSTLSPTFVLGESVGPRRK